MTIDITKGYEIDENGLLISDVSGDIVWIGGGTSAPTHSAPIGSQYFRTNGEKYIQQGPGNTDWELFSIKHILGHRIYHPLFETSKPHREESSTNYTLHGNACFPGSNNFGTLSKIHGITWVESDAAYIKIYDYNNGLTIVEKQITNTDKDCIDLGTLSNVPTDQAIFEIHLKKDTGKIFIAGIILEYI